MTPNPGEVGALPAFATMNGVTFTYAVSDGPALDNVSLDIASDKLTLVSGPSGSGKTTLARLLGGFIPHYVEGTLAGEVELLGQPLEGEHRKTVIHDIGFVFDNPFDQLTGATRTLFDEVAFALENEGVPVEEIGRRVMSALAAVGLADRATQHPRDVSGGQSQRLALATVLAQDKKGVVLDDPTSQLDPAGRAEVVELVAELRRKGVTVVVTANDLEPWLPMTDELIVLDDAAVVAAGDPRSIINRGDLWTSCLREPRFVSIWRSLATSELACDTRVPVDVDELIGALRPASPHRGAPS